MTQSDGNTSPKFKVLMVVPKWSGGNPEYGYDTVGHFWHTLEISGLAQVDYFYYDEISALSKIPCDSALMGRVMDNQPDMVMLNWHCGAEINPKPETLQSISKRIPVAAFWFDTVWSLHTRIAEALSNVVHLHVILDSSAPYTVVPHPEEYLFLWAPVDPTLFYLGEKRDNPISYLGRLVKPGRKEAIDALKAAGLEVVTGGGYGAGHVQLSWEEYADVYRRSKIVVNFSKSPADFGHYQLTGRVSEVLFSGALLLEEENPETPGLLEPMLDYVPFSGLEDLVEKARYYLEHEEKRAAIATHGHQTAMERYNHVIFWNTVFYHLLGGA